MNERGRINGEACLHAHLVIRLPIRQLTVTMPSRASLLSKERIIFILNGWKVGKFAMTGIKRRLRGRSDKSVFPKGAGKRRRFLYLIIRAARCRLFSPEPFLSLCLAFVHKIGKEKTRKAKPARRAGDAARVHADFGGKRRVFGPAADHERPFLPQREGQPRRRRGNTPGDCPLQHGMEEKMALRGALSRRPGLGVVLSRTFH